MGLAAGIWITGDGSAGVAGNVESPASVVKAGSGVKTGSKGTAGPGAKAGSGEGSIFTSGAGACVPGSGWP